MTTTKDGRRVTGRAGARSASPSLGPPVVPESDIVAPPELARAAPTAAAAAMELSKSLGQVRYCFTLTTSTRQRPVGEMQGGYRVDFDYWRESGAFTCGPGSVLGPIKALIETARIVSGSDWAFVSSLGIVDFDSRVTARLGGATPEEQCLIAGRFRGRADLAKARSASHTRLFEPGVDRNTVVSRWKAGLPEKSYIPLVLAVTFEVPIENVDRSHADLYAQVRLLGETLLIGSGSAELLGGPYGAVGEIKLDLFSVEPLEAIK